MDHDTSTTSVTSAMLDAQQKIKSLQEDRELYATLGAKAVANFERHRSELTLLLQKERAIHAASEDRLRRQLQHLLEENEDAQAKLQSLRMEREQHCCDDIQRQRQQCDMREEAQRCEVLELRKTLTAARDDVEVAQKEKYWHEMQLHETLAYQQALYADLQQLRQEFGEPSTSRPRRQSVAKSVREKIFLPCGPADECCPETPASHHIAAIVSTVERQRLYWPRLYYRRRGIPSPFDGRRGSEPRCRSNSSRTSTATHRNSLPGSSRAQRTAAPSIVMTPKATARGSATNSSALPCSGPAVDLSAATTVTSKVDHSVTYSGRNLDAVCRSLLRDVLRMRKEYQECTSALDNPDAETIELSRRMRSLMHDIDRKLKQLRAMRQQKAKVGDKLRMHDMLVEIAQENSYCESVYNDLLELIRS
uniref:Uncharacterized protein TCIL3000_11_12180 n=1 Tax=Trypanosoma congolense (strain IL3000) TaxID=1068625 RepID=G0V253_TRYCI|nr:unnamed protein product [Trypanosoma congolense IL3000]